MSTEPTRTTAVLDTLREFESPNITFLPEQGNWPIVWERAKGMNVWDVEGKEYLDFTAAFGVAAAGHAATPVVRAGQRQMGQLLHAMGDVHPHALKAQLAKRLSDLTFKRWDADYGGDASETGGAGKVVFCNSGFEAVEVALKTACQATGRNRIVSFESAYHGLGYGALVATDREHFRGRFGAQLAAFGDVAPFPVTSSELESLDATLTELLKGGEVGALLVEPIQARGGIRVPPPEFLTLLRDHCDRSGALLVLDEIYTGFGRTGAWFACEHDGIVPDLICLGKALTGGFPLSAMVGRAEIMDAAWPRSTGEAIHTSTYLGHPVGCAMALAQLDLIESKRLVELSARMGIYFIAAWKRRVGDDRERATLRGHGLMQGIELTTTDGKPATDQCLRLIETLLTDGFILLPDGESANVVGVTPPLIVTRKQIDAFLDRFFQRYREGATG